MSDKARDAAIELLPCPFDGGEAEICQIGNEYTKNRSTEIRCKTFGCTVKIIVGAIRQSHEWTREKAVERWNIQHDACRAARDWIPIHSADDLPKEFGDYLWKKFEGGYQVLDFIASSNHDYFQDHFKAYMPIPKYTPASDGAIEAKQ